jgi:hypothetical protein
MIMELNTERKATGGDQTISAAGDEQREHSTTHTAHSGNSASAQRARLLIRLRLMPVDTITARRELDILMPAARICELRKQGRQIDTVRVMRPTDEGKLHSVALYVLQPGEVSDE